MRLRETPVPLVVQANKQDVKGALGPKEIRKRLKLDSETPVVAANAAAGEGVQETLRTAVRLGISAMVAAGKVAPLAAEFKNADALFDHVLTFEDAPTQDREIEVEELDVNAEYVPMAEDAMAAHLSATSLDALESRARRAAKKAKAADSEG